MIRIWGRASSSNVQAVMWAMAEMGLACDRLDVGYTYGGNDTPEFLAMNPNGTIPVLQDGDNRPIWETGAILRYLAGKYAADDFWPKNPERRAEVDQWAEWAKINVSIRFTAPIFWHVVRTAPSKQDPQAVSRAMTALNRSLAIAEAQLEGQDYLVASGFTLADIQFGHLLYRYFDIDITRTRFPNIDTYYHRLMARDAYREHVMVSYEELRVLD